MSPAFGTASRAHEPTASPDGQQIAFTAFVHDSLDGLPRRGIFALDGTSLNEIAGGAGSAWWPRFSPDGLTLSFLSDRAQAQIAQLYLLQADLRGKARPAPAVPGTVEYSAWSPDGTKILLIVAGLGADIAGSQGSGTTFEPIEDTPTWLPRVEAGTSEGAWRSLWLVDVATGALRRLSPEGLNTWEATWLGTDAVVAVTSPRPDESAWYTAALTRIHLDGDISRVATSDVQFGLPAGSPDGSRLAVVEAICSDRGLVAGDLRVGPIHALRAMSTAGVDVTWTQWLDRARLGFLGIRGLETVAAILDVTTGEVTEVWRSTDSSCGVEYPEGVFLADGRVLVLEDGYSLPQQVAILGGQTRETHPLPNREGALYVTSVNGRAEPTAWHAPDGTRIEGILCRPEGQGPFPLILSVHGGPVWAFRNTWSMLYDWIPLLVSHGFAVLNPNPRGSSGRGQAFARHVVGDMGGADTQDFLSGIDALVERGLADPRKLAVMGRSYGGYMAAWLVTQDSRFRATVPISPVTDWYSQHFTSNIPSFDTLFLGGSPEAPGDNFHARSPVAHASKARTPCLVLAGAMDRCTPPGQAEEFHRALLEHGAPSQLVVYPEEGHGVRAFPALIDSCTRMTAFLQEHLQ
jgi:dipeptidyl aminopeptidase/acylaminoacyl peptidase